MKIKTVLVFVLANVLVFNGVISAASASTIGAKRESTLRKARPAPPVESKISVDPVKVAPANKSNSSRVSVSKKKLLKSPGKVRKLSGSLGKSQARILAISKETRGTSAKACSCSLSPSDGGDCMIPCLTEWGAAVPDWLWSFCISQCLQLNIACATCLQVSMVILTICGVQCFFL